MSSRVERTVPQRSYRSEKVIINFDAERLKAPFSLRCGAILIDYILLITIPVTSLLLGRFFNYDGTKLLNSEISNAGWLIAILLTLTNFIILPLLTGQSIGKMLTGLKVVKTDGSEPTLKNLLIRHLIGYPLMFLTLGFGFLISVFNQKGRALHDYLAQTVVIYGRKQTKEIQN
jgi:uncharacterized RDD family membrane protein YckC